MIVDPAVAWLVVGCTVLLFGAGAVNKLRDLRGFAEVFAAYRVLPATAGRLSAQAVPWLEALVASGLLFGETRKTAAFVGIVLLLAYAGAIAVNLRRGRRHIACGCGGPDDRRAIASWMVWRNVGIAALLAAVVLLPLSPRSLVLTDGATIVFGTGTVALIYLCVDRLLEQAGRLSDELRTHS